MKLREAINALANMRDVRVDENLLYLWLSELDGRVQTDIMLLDNTAVTVYSEEQYDAELVIRPPHDAIYIDWLIYKTAQYYGESDRSQLLGAGFERKYREYAAWYMNHKRPRRYNPNQNPNQNPSGTAEVTRESILKALGYTPADEQELIRIGNDLESKQPAGDYATNADIPTKTSALYNDSGYITRAVGDLINYYAKSMIYTKDETEALLAEIPKISFAVVTELPTENISTNTIYLLRDSADGTYQEYIYVKGEWVNIGGQRIDLTGYAKEEWVNGKLRDYLTKEELDAVLIAAVLGYVPAKQADAERISENVRTVAGRVDTLALDIDGLTGYAEGVAQEVGTLQQDVALIPVEVTPQRYGAVGDGVKDNAAAFAEALAKHRVVFVPGGTYLLSHPITIHDNCCLELSQDTVLVFTNTTGRCITLGLLSCLKGNHATVKVPYAFDGNVIYANANDSTLAEQSAVPPFTKWDPQWKMGRYVTDINICKADHRGNHGAVNPGDCKGTAVYLTADGNTANTVSYMWGNHFSGLRIAGAFAYGIRAVNYDGGWMHEMRIDAFIDACEIGVSLESCSQTYISAVIQPRQAFSDEKVYEPYAKHGIELISSKNTDLSGSRIWDWTIVEQSKRKTLWTEGGEYQPYKMIGDCSGTIINDYAYYINGDTRQYIYTDRPDNLERLTILQEPFTRWFKPLQGEPYYYDGFSNRRLLTENSLDPFFSVDFIKYYTDVLAGATEADDETIFNKIGYQTGVRFLSLGSGTTLEPSIYYMVTGFIRVPLGSKIYAHAMSFADISKTYAGIVYYNSSHQRIASMAIQNVVNGAASYVTSYTELDDGCSFVIPNSPTLIRDDATYIRLCFPMNCVGEHPMMSINEEIKYDIEGFLADSVKVKGENIVGVPGYDTPDWEARKTVDEGDTVWDERVIPYKGGTIFLSDHGGGFNINAGIGYDVFWNGDIYQTEAKQYDSEPYLGNGSLVFSGAEDTGEPFCLYGSFMAPDTIAYLKMAAENSGDITVKVTLRGTVIYDKMPVGYLPEEAALKSDIFPVTGTPGQVISFDAEGNPVPMPFVTMEGTGGSGANKNLIPLTAGWTSGYGQIAGPINPQTLEVPFDTALMKTDLHYTYNALIPLEGNTTYAFSKGYTIAGAVFTRGTGGRSGYVTNAVMTDGDNCLLYTTPSAQDGYYFALSVHRGAFEDLDAFRIAKGSSLDGDSTAGTETVKYLDASIKVNAAQVEGLEEMLPEADQSVGADTVSVLAETAKKVKAYQKPDSLTIAPLWSLQE